MDTAALAVETTPDPADVAFLQDQINHFNVAATDISDGQLLAFFVRDHAGAMVAGLYGWTWGGCCEIRSLWVAEEYRDQGYGSRLLAAAELEATTRGCTQTILDTHEFQAPHFYQRYGYEIVGVVENYPRGYRKYFLSKTLTDQTMAPKMQTDSPVI